MKLKNQLFASMSANFVTKILLKSTSKCLSNDMLIIFFGYVVVKNSIMEDCFPDVKSHKKWIEFNENSIFHEFLMDLNASTFKNSKLCEYVSKFCERNFAEKYSR